MTRKQASHFVNFPSFPEQVETLMRYSSSLKPAAQGQMWCARQYFVAIYLTWKISVSMARSGEFDNGDCYKATDKKPLQIHNSRSMHLTSKNESLRCFEIIYPCELSRMFRQTMCHFESTYSTCVAVSSPPWTLISIVQTDEHLQTTDDLIRKTTSQSSRFTVDVLKSLISIISSPYTKPYQMTQWSKKYDVCGTVSHLAVVAVLVSCIKHWLRAYNKIP